MEVSYKALTLVIGGHGNRLTVAKTLTDSRKAMEPT